MSAPRWTQCTCDTADFTLPLPANPLPELHDKGCPLEDDNAEIQKRREAQQQEAA